MPTCNWVMMPENEWTDEIYSASAGPTAFPAVTIRMDQNTTYVLRKLVKVLEREKPLDAVKFIKNLTI